MVMELTAGIGAAEFRMGAELGEWGAREIALRTPDPGTKARPDSPSEPEGALRLILAWARPLCARRNAVEYATELVCDR